MGKSQSDVSSLQFDEPLPTATPVEVPAGRPLMAPPRAVSPEIARLLPPVGILRVAPVASPPITQPEPGPPVAAAGGEVKTSPATGSSVVMTLAVIATAMGVGALAMIPALDRDRERKPPLSDPADTPLRVFAADAAAIEQLPTERRITEPSRSPTSSPAAGAGLQPAVDPASEAALDSHLAEIQRLLRERDIAGATEKLRQVAARPQSERQAERIAQAGALLAAVHSFWESFEDALDNAPAGRSVQWGGQEAVLVEAGPSYVILRSAGQNVQIARNDLSAEHIRSLAESLMDLGDPRNQVPLGAFQFVTQGPASREARRLWERAAEAGEDVSLLMPLLMEP